MKRTGWGKNKKEEEEKEQLGTELFLELTLEIGLSISAEVFHMQNSAESKGEPCGSSTKIWSSARSEQGEELESSTAHTGSSAPSWPLRSPCDESFSYFSCCYTNIVFLQNIFALRSDLFSVRISSPLLVSYFFLI